MSGKMSRRQRFRQAFPIITCAVLGIHQVFSSQLYLVYSALQHCIVCIMGTRYTRCFVTYFREPIGVVQQRLLLYFCLFSILYCWLANHIYSNLSVYFHRQRTNKEFCFSLFQPLVGQFWALSHIIILVTTTYFSMSSQ